MFSVLGAAWKAKQPNNGPLYPKVAVHLRAKPGDVEKLLVNAAWHHSSLAVEGALQTLPGLLADASLLPVATCGTSKGWGLMTGSVAGPKAFGKLVLAPFSP